MSKSNLAICYYEKQIDKKFFMHLLYDKIRDQ